MLFFERINVLSLIRKHFSTLYDNRTKSISRSEIISLSVCAFGIPAILVYFLKQPLNTSETNCFFTVFSIAIGFLASTLFVVAQKKDDSKEADFVIKIKECFYNTAFSLIASIIIILCYLTMIISVKALADFKLSEYIPYVLNIGSFIIYAFIVLFFHSMLMVIKRVFYIFDKN